MRRATAVACLMLSAGTCFGGVNFYSYSKERALGKELARDVEWQSRMIDDPIICEYVNRLGQNLANNSDAGFPVTVKVIRSPEVNAFALPGGYIFVNSGLIRAATTEAELAGALAHEIGHVAARHYTREQSLKELMSLAGIPLMVAGGTPGFAIAKGLEAAGPLVLLKYSRSSEKQADVLGIQYLYRAGYDPLALVDFLERVSVLEGSNPGAFARMFAMHPPAADRIRALQDEIGRSLSPREQYEIQTSEFQAIQNRLASIERGDYVPWRYPRSPSGPSDARPVLRRTSASRE
jgi:beta-barrel assembly-enhancing protease